MIIDIITAFPGMVREPLGYSMAARAVRQDIAKINIHDLRNWATDRHRTIDDTPYGGGAGMIYKVGPLYACLSELVNDDCDQCKILLTSPRGAVFSQAEAVKLSLCERIILICGHYKGVDERIKSFFPIDEVSIGDYILSGGEIAALAVTDAIIRLLPGVIGDMDSAFSDSFSDDLLDCEYYTRPEDFKGERVPDVLLSAKAMRTATCPGWIDMKCKSRNSLRYALPGAFSHRGRK